MQKREWPLPDSLLVDLLSDKNRRYPMRKNTYLRIRRILEITKVILVIILLILTIFKY